MHMNSKLTQLGLSFVAMLFMLAACGLIHNSKAAPPSLAGKLVAVPGEPPGPPVPADSITIQFTGRWLNASGHSVTVRSDVNVYLVLNGRVFAPWGLGTKAYCYKENGHEICERLLHNNPRLVTIKSHSSLPLISEFVFPRRYCGRVASVRIRGLPGALSLRVPCNAR
jgi:hypothetical protein